VTFLPVVDKGMAVLFNEQAMSNTLTHENVTIDVQLGLGKDKSQPYAVATALPKPS
jgi:glutamate N-acetyltransferase/amino-acid N-acetyltransferase